MSAAEEITWGAVKPWPIEVCRQQVRLLDLDSPAEVIETKAQELHDAILKTAEFEREVALSIQKIPSYMRPIDQSRETTEAQRKKFRFVDARWSLSLRWPWVAVWEGGEWNMERPPWLMAEHLKSVHNDISNCLMYCMKNHEHLPLFCPIRGPVFHGPASNPTQLPRLNTVGGSWIPRGIVKQFPQARCAEALAFVYNFRGGVEMEEIRRLIVAPTPEKVAIAYTIANGSNFRRQRLVERELARDDLQPGDALKTMPELQSEHPELLKDGSTAKRVLATLRARPNEALSINELSGGSGGRGRAGGGTRKGTKHALEALLKVGLIAKAGASWKLGPAARRN